MATAQEPPSGPPSGPPPSGPPPNPPSGPPPSPPGVTARKILGKWPVWVFPAVLVTLVSFALALVYSGGIGNPQGSTHHLPIGLVNQDAGPLGGQMVQGIADAPDPDQRVDWKIMSPAQAKDAFDSGRLYGAISVPVGFTASLESIIAPAGSPVLAKPPQVTLLTNPGAGSLASSLATGVEQQALRAASAQIGAQLDTRLRATGAQPSTAQTMLLADPISTTTVPGHALATRTGLGLTAFYVALLVVMSGFLGANIISGGVDSALGYAPSELGPRRQVRTAVPISRFQTLIVKMVMSAVLSLVTASVVVLATAAVVRLDMPHLPQLWLFAFCASAVVGVGVQAVIAVFGGLGQVVSMFFFVALAIPSAGATIPLESLPGFYRFIAQFEPMRQISGGVRAIMYFDARGDAGLQRAWIMLALGLAVALLLGLGITRWYDHRGYHRIHPSDRLPAA
ncbi:YhgE/Pip domain-containing protein [Streptacidiphilus cavernicola]|uniref:YhgE/Pip domain-containing protein n=1 Tax=Streptacidiphilus cavernicola TaxID=3342716 RepID=A0ABV6VWI4_9ACTN